MSELTTLIENEQCDEAIARINDLARSSFFTHDESAMSVLHIAVASDHVGLVRALQDAGVDILLTDSFHMNVLHVAIERWAEAVSEVCARACVCATPKHRLSPSHL